MNKSPCQVKEVTERRRKAERRKKEKEELERKEGQKCIAMMFGWISKRTKDETL